MIGNRRIPGCFVGVGLVLACFYPQALASGVEESASLPRLGINLSGLCDWNTELPFVDVFRLSRAWISQKEGGGWGSGPNLETDERGWVKRLQPGAYAETLMCTMEGGHYPSGQYTILYEGEGTIKINGARVISEAPGKLVVDVDSKRGAIFLQLRKTNPENYVRNIRVIMPGFESTYEKEPWRPDFLARWKGVACLRFMDCMDTNGSSIVSWNERPRLDAANATTQGAPLEWMIDLANRLNADPWFCMPHKANDDYIRQFAQMVKEQLHSNLKVYVEYSNEAWNGGFEQASYVGDQGLALGFAKQKWEAGWRYTAYRSVQIFKIWEEVFGGVQRLVRVLPSQAANSYVSKQIVEFQDAYKSADALAIAPYVSFIVSPTGNPSASEVAGWTVERVLDHAENTALPEAIRWIKEQKVVADQYGLALIAYEAGQHLVGVSGGENNEAMTALFHKANAHPRMGAIYQKYYKAWEQNGGGLLCAFSSVSSWSKWGSWGLLQYDDEDPAQSPKFMATMQWASEQGQNVSLPTTKTSNSLLHQ